MSVGGLIGAAIGFFVPVIGPALGYAIGSGIDAAVNAPDNVLTGPRLEELRTQLSTYGAPIPWEWGTNRHAGTIIWPKTLDAREDRTETTTSSGGFLGFGETDTTTVTFAYKLSCAVLVCEGPIAGITRIWANKKLVYDVTAANTGETQDAVIGSVRFHLGTETQDADPLIEATDGEGPHYLGYAYVVFEDYDVTDLGGRPPQWEFEVIADGSTVIPPATTYGQTYNSDGKFQADMDENGHLWLSTMWGNAVTDPVTGLPVIDLVAPNTPQIQEYDTATGELLWFTNVAAYADVRPVIPFETAEDIAATGGDDTTVPIGGASVYFNGVFYVGRGSPGLARPSVRACPDTDPVIYCIKTAHQYAHGLTVSTGHAVGYDVDTYSSGEFQNAFYWPSAPVPLGGDVYWVGGNGLSGGFGVGFGAGVGAAQLGGEPCLCGISLTFTGISITLPGWALKVTSFGTGTPSPGVIVQGYGRWVWGMAGEFVLPGSSTVSIAAIAYDVPREKFWAFAGDNYNQLYSSGGVAVIDPATLSVYTVPAEYGSRVVGMAVQQDTGYLWVLVSGGVDPAHMLLFDPYTLTVLQDIDTGMVISWVTGKMWDVPSQHMVVYTNGYVIINIPYGSLLPGQVPLSTIVSDLCVRAELSTADIDVTQLTDLVDGYIVPRQMTARAAIEPLQQAYFFDAVESDDKIKFVKRGGAIAATIPLAERAAHEDGQDMPDHLSILRSFELELPAECDVEYPDLDADHLVGNQYERRITKDTRQKINLQLPIVMPAAKAKQVARVLLYQAWLNQSYRWRTSRKYAYLEPTDLVQLPTALATYAARITVKRELPGGVIEWEGQTEDPAVYIQPNSGAAATGYLPQTIFVPDATVLALLDVPLMRDEDDNAGYYVAMGGAL